MIKLLLSLIEALGSVRGKSKKQIDDEIDAELRRRRQKRPA